MHHFQWIQNYNTLGFKNFTMTYKTRRRRQHDLPVVGSSAVVPHDHHLLGRLKVPDGAEVPLSPVLLAPLPVGAPDHPAAHPLHDQLVASWRPGRPGAPAHGAGRHGAHGVALGHAEGDAADRARA